jgi:hypothetical protein
VSTAETIKVETTKCPDCGAELPTYARGEPHLLHTDPEYRRAWDLTLGRFQVFVYPQEPDSDDEADIDSRTRRLASGPRQFVEIIVPVLQRWLDEQAAKVSVP